MTLTPEQRAEYEVLLQHLDMKTGTYICLEAAQVIRELLAIVDQQSGEKK